MSNPGQLQFLYAESPKETKAGEVGTRSVSERHCCRQTVEGKQAVGVQPCAKHFIGNEQELNRQKLSSNIDDRTLHELPVWPFVDASRPT